MRPRDSLLEALSLFKTLNPTITVNEIVSFLYTCENEGLSVQELAYVSRMTEPTASRSIRSFGPPDSEWARPPACGLVEAFLNPNDGRGRVLHLTAEGRAMRARLDEIISQAIAIAR
ncbi:MarR family winged helix-turn-helix transcriptional regulator [Phenylobacterium sp.]|uniref:MarR family winged helix-turn-helix transcriptional regulator n=1 Tax=Phenylobacterium sp. TaxID=1871053 RepID=UPI00286A0D65|nr:MarR family winged helix-turn-helix transcriptional regulator [Phenylobacterium sp.]